MKKYFLYLIHINNQFGFRNTQKEGCLHPAEQVRSSLASSFFVSCKRSISVAEKNKAAWIPFLSFFQKSIGFLWFFMGYPREKNAFGLHFRQNDV
jgi:hypothetical protein